MAQKKQGIIIGLEGPDGAGKDTFVAGFYAYMNGWISFISDNKNRGFAYQPMVTYDQIKDYVANVWPDNNTQVLGPKPKIKFLNIREGSESCAQFMHDIHSGKISDPSEVAKGYLKIHVEYTEKALELTEEYDLVIMNRTLMSFECLQLRTLGLIECRSYFNQLVEKYQQDKFPHVVLLPRKEVVIARARSKNVSALDKVFTDKIDAAYQAYSDAVSRDTHENGNLKSLWDNVIVVAAEDVKDYFPVYELMLNQTIRRFWNESPDA